MSQNAASLLGTIALTLGGIAGGLSLLDLALSRSAKDKIKDKAATAWIWLSYQRTWPYVRAVRSRRAFYIVFALAISLPALFYVVGFLTMSFPGNLPLLQFNLVLLALLALVGVPSAIFFFLRRYALRIYLWATEKPSTLSYLLRPLAVYMAILLAALAVNAPGFGRLSP